MTLGKKIKMKAQDAVNFHNAIVEGETFVTDKEMAFLDLENEIYIATEALTLAKRMIKDETI